MNEIALPVGTTQVSVKEIPALIALAIHPRVPAGRVVSYLVKHIPSTASKSGHDAPLTDAERAVLGNIWRDLPALEPGAHEADWPRYAKAFDSAKKKPKWKPVPVWRNDALNADILRIDAEEAHHRALGAAISRGELVGLNHAGLPVNMAYPDAVVTVGALRQYAARFEVGVRVAEPSATVDAPKSIIETATAARASNSSAAKLRIQAEAFEEWIRWLARGAQPSVNAISEQMARWCIDNEVRTRSGVNPRQGTIRNTILGGASGWKPPTLSREQARAHVARLAQVARE